MNNNGMNGDDRVASNDVPPPPRTMQRYNNTNGNNKSQSLSKRQGSGDAIVISDSDDDDGPIIVADTNPRTVKATPSRSVIPIDVDKEQPRILAERKTATGVTRLVSVKRDSPASKMLERLNKQRAKPSQGIDTIYIDGYSPPPPGPAPPPAGITRHHSSASMSQTAPVPKPRDVDVIDLDELSEDDDEIWSLVSEILTGVAGCHGSIRGVGAGELVILRRQKTTGTIEVMTCDYSTIGRLSAQLTYVVGPLMDKMTVKLEGHVTRFESSTLKVYCPIDRMETVTAVLQVLNNRTHSAHGESVYAVVPSKPSRPVRPMSEPVPVKQDPTPPPAQYTYPDQFADAHRHIQETLSRLGSSRQWMHTKPEPQFQDPTGFHIPTPGGGHDDYLRDAMERRKHDLERMSAVNIDNLFTASFLGVSMDGKDLPRTPKPTGITTSLFPHQEQALAWMTSRENDAYSEIGPNNKTHFFWTWHSDGTFENMLTHQRTANKRDVQFPGGGLLCDDMGLGKTLSFLSLCVAQRESERKRYPGRKIRTLVIAPTSVLQEWADQIEQHIDADMVSYKVLIYHDPAVRTLDNLLSADIVITSYGVIRQEHTKSKAQDEDVDRMYKMRRVENGDGYIDVEDRGLFTDDMFHRIICDEGQKIKNHKSMSSEAVRNLRAKMRWISTGTPLNNNLTELYAMYAAIKAKPFDDSDIWGSIIRLPLKSHDLTAKEAGFKRLQTLVKATCLRRVKSRPSAVSANQPGTVLLPELEINKREIELSKPEQILYDHIEKKSREKLMDALHNKGVELKNFACVLALLCRMRQACCHPYLVLTKANNQLLNDDVADIKDTLNDLMKADEDDDDIKLPEDVINRVRAFIDSDDFECPICLLQVVPSERVITSCGHIFCYKCIYPALAHNSICPICRRPLNTSDVRALQDVKDLDNQPKDEVEEAIRREKFVTSSKIVSLIDDINTKMSPEQKILVFTQWTSHMDLIAEQFQAHGIGYVKLVGSMSRRERTEAIKTFQTCRATRCKAFLISLHAGGFGLNLTAASHVAMMDLWWNVAVEQQAIDRAWRLGNTSPNVTVWRYVTKRTVEERIIELQEAKEFVVHSAFGSKGYNHKESATKLSELQRKMIYLVMGQRTSSVENLV